MHDLQPIDISHGKKNGLGRVSHHSREFVDEGQAAPHFGGPGHRHHKVDIGQIVA